MQRQIVIYTGKKCHRCEIVKEFLNRHGIGFEERNVHVQREYVKDLLEQRIRTLPVLVIDGEYHADCSDELLATLVERPGPE